MNCFSVLLHCVVLQWILLQSIVHVNSISKFPKVEMNLLYAPKDTSISRQVIETNKSLVTLEIVCTHDKPVTWEFNFDPYVFHWTDSFWLLATRSLQNFYNTSSYTYTAVLNLRWHNPPVPQILSCQQISNTNVSTSVIANLSSSTNDSIRFQYSQKSSALLLTHVNRTKESECGVIYSVQRIQPGKIQWKCEGADGTQIKMKYRQSWFCTTENQCANYYSKAKRRPTCVRDLKAEDTCDGCLISSDVSTMIMFCKIDTNHWVQPIVYSVDSQTSIPKLHIKRDNTVPEDMMKIDKVPPELYPGDELIITCSVSEYFFAAPAIFAVKYSYSDTLEFTISKTNFTFLSGTAQTYSNYYKDEYNGEFDISRNIRTYAHKINISERSGQIENVYCFAPLWNSESWVNKSTRVNIKQGSRRSGCRLQSLDVPKIIIIPGSIAIYSTPKLLIAKNQESVTMLLNCTSPLPIKWSLSFGDEYRANTIVTVEKTERNEYRSVLRLSFPKIPIGKFSCEVFNNSCLRRTVQVKTHNATENTIKTFLLPYTEPPTSSNRKDECFTQFIVKMIDKHSFKWKSVDFYHQEEKMNAVSQISCANFLSCRLFYNEEIQKSKKCLKVLAAHENCEDCDIFPTGIYKYPTGYLRAEHRSRVAFQPFFYSVTSDIKERQLFFSWKDVKPHNMIKMNSAPEIAYTGEELKLVCSISAYYFVKGFRFVLQFTNHSTFLSDDHNNTIFDQVNGVYRLSANLLLTQDYLMLKSIYCMGTPAMTKGEVSTTPHKITVYKSSKPRFLPTLDRYSFSKGDVDKSIKCKADGVPEPTVSWKLSQEKIDAGFIDNGSVLLFPKMETTFSGIYICIANNAAGNTEKRFQVDITAVTSHTGLIIGVSVTILLVFLIVLVVKLYIKFGKIQKAIDVITEEDIKAFREGTSFFPSGGIENDNIPIYSAAFNHLYEILPAQFEIYKTQFLGGGAYGSVFLGKYTTDKNSYSVAVKTVDPSLDIMYFKALLSEIKVMAYIGQHDNILEFIGACTENIHIKEIYILTELCPNGNLHNFLKCNRLLFNLNPDVCVSEEKVSTTGLVVVYDNINEMLQTSKNRSYDNVFKEYNISHLNNWSYQIARGMEYLEQKKVIHGDIAARNVLLTAENNAKVSDFGLARQLVDYSTYVKTTKSPLPWRWMAIESLKDMTFSIKSDVWSYGITLWEIYSLAEVPYPGWSLTNEFMDNLKNGLRLSKPKSCPEEVYDIMVSCWDVDPSNRPSFSQIMGAFEILQNNQNNF